MWILVYNRKKELITTKTKNRQIAIQLLREAIRKAQRNRDKVYTTNILSFTPLLIDLIIL